MAQKKQPKTKAKTRIIIVDDHPIVRSGLIGLLQNQEDLEVCGEAEDAPDALKKVAKEKPDLVIIDISLKTTSGLDLIKDIKARYPNTLMLVLSVHDESIYIERVLKAGAKGYIMKKEIATKVVAAIRKVLKGEIYLSDKMSSKMMDIFIGSKPETPGLSIRQLSDRELEVFQLIGKGFKTGRIAKTLKISTSTVEYHRAHIKEKLKLKDASELTRMAVQWMTEQGAN